MSDLGQQLRELGRDQFESLVHQILVAKYPNAGIKKVDGAGGDEGIDSFEGTLESRPAIWQSKHFINGIKKAQRSQILKSIKAAFAKRKPSRWTLCVPINLQTNEHAWFQSNIVQPYGRKCQIRLLQGSDILSDLYPNRTLRDAFFPENSISNVMKVREMAMKTELMSPVERKMVAIEYAEQFLEAKENLDPRLKGVFSVGHSSSYWDVCQEKGALVSVSEGETVTTFFPRNVTEYNRDPIQVSFCTKDGNLSLLDAALDYGKSVTLPVGELLDIRFSSELLNSFFVGKDPNKLQLELRPLLPKAIQGKDIPMRLTAGNNQQSATLDYIPFRVQQLGRKRARLVSGGPLPIEFVITVPAAAGENGSIRLAPKFRGAEVRLVQKVLEFVETLQEFGQLEVWCLDPNLVMLRQVSVSKSGLTIEPGFKKIVIDAVIVARFFNTNIYLPEKIRPSDWENLSMLKRIAAREEFSDIDISVRLVKQDSFKDLVLDALAKERLSLRIEANTSAQRIKLFDGEIDPGPIIFETQEATVIRPKETLEAYLSADEESAVELKLHCDGACRYIANQRLM